jgi:hypothetical protein
MGKCSVMGQIFWLFLCILLRHPHKNPADSMKTSVWPKCEPVAYVMQLHEQKQLFFGFFTRSHPQNLCQNLAVNMCITREAQNYSRYEIELIIHGT